MSTPSLDVLRIQAEHIRQQADTLRDHLITHCIDAWGDSQKHLETAVSCCESAAILATHAHASMQCAIEAQKPLPVCAGDGKGGAA